jgi:hypothetical protein
MEPDRKDLVSREGYATPNVLDQNCESRQALELISDKWTALADTASCAAPSMGSRRRC